MTLDTTDAEIKKTYEAVRNGKDIDWCTFTYVKGSDTKVKLDKQGSFFFVYLFIHNLTLGLNSKVLVVLMIYEIICATVLCNIAS